MWAGSWGLTQEEMDASEMGGKCPVLFCLHCWWLQGGEMNTKGNTPEHPGKVVMPACTLTCSLLLLIFVGHFTFTSLTSCA